MAVKVKAEKQSDQRIVEQLSIFNGMVVAITGASSGLGRALAVEFYKKGARLAISDIAEDGLEETGNIIKGSDETVKKYLVDVSDVDQVREYAQSVVNDFGCVDIIVNNAGVGILGLIKNTPYEEFEWIINTNLWGVIYGTKEFLPYLLDRPRAYIINISSAAGICGAYTLGAYCTTKFAVRGFTESLTQELSNTNVKSVLVMPDFFRTNVFRNGKCFLNKATKEEIVQAYDDELTVTASEVAKSILKGVEKGKQRMILGKMGNNMDKMVRLFPNYHRKIILKKVTKKRGFDE